jgi:two-component system sensor histidine kinase KdpD
VRALRSRAAVAALRWGLALVAASALLLAFRARLDEAHGALILLLVVLGGSADGGRVVGLGLSGAAFLLFNWIFVVPYGTLAVSDPRDWLVLVAFLVTSVVAASLLQRAQREALLATARAAEVDRLATLGAETLSAGRAEDALAAVADVIQRTTGVDRCEIFRRRDGDGGLELAASAPAPGEPGEPGGARRDAGEESSLPRWVAESGNAAGALHDGTVHVYQARPGPDELARLAPRSARTLLLPLAARRQTVGVLRLTRADGLALDADGWRFLDAISYYAALAVERVRLIADAERAAALREADRLKDALLASVSHDLRTPLTTIKALAHDLRTPGDERAAVIEQEADRLNRMVADLLDLSRLGAGSLRVRPEVNAVDDLLGALVQRVEPTLGGRPLAVSLPAGDALLLARFDLPHSLRILVNLVENAARYAPGPSPIEVAAARAGEEVAVRVLDRGPGVPAGEGERIFEPFYRPPGAPPDVGGAGLGLAIARQLAEAQGGRLEYTPRPGGGSEFTLRLPAAALDEPASPEAPAERPGARSS